MVAVFTDFLANHLSEERLDSMAQAWLGRDGCSKRAPLANDAEYSGALLHCREPAKLVQERGRSAHA